MKIIGLISGTSVDGIDAACIEVAEIAGGDRPLQVRYLAGETFAYDRALRAEILAVCAGEPRSLAQLAALDDAIAAVFAEAALALIAKTATQPELLASHGQTVYHRPPGVADGASADDLGYTVQLGRGAAIARQTHIPTVSNFRVADIESGGHGAPMVPMVDWLLLSHPQKTRCVQNIGGIGNVAYLAAGGPKEAVFGFDNAPGNVLIDMAAQRLFHVPFDAAGKLASRGKADGMLVDRWLQHAFFHVQPPKSTGRELFSPGFLDSCLQDCARAFLTPHDTLATLTELTVQAIAGSYRQFLPRFPDEVLVCGGGCRNLYLMERLRAVLAPTLVDTTDAASVPADLKEAVAFAVLGYLTWHRQPGNLPRVTGAKKEVILGQIHYS